MRLQADVGHGARRGDATAGQLDSESSESSDDGWGLDDDIMDDAIIDILESVPAVDTAPQADVVSKWVDTQPPNQSPPELVQTRELLSSRDKTGSVLTSEQSPTDALTRKLPGEKKVHEKTCAASEEAHRAQTEAPNLLDMPAVTPSSVWGSSADASHAKVTPGYGLACGRLGCEVPSMKPVSGAEIDNLSGRQRTNFVTDSESGKSVIHTLAAEAGTTDLSTESQLSPTDNTSIPDVAATDVDPVFGDLSSVRARACTIRIALSLGGLFLKCVRLLDAFRRWYIKARWSSTRRTRSAYQHVATSDILIRFSRLLRLSRQLRQLR